MNGLYECALCGLDEMEVRLLDNTFLMETNTGSFRARFVCEDCGQRLRAISTDWAHVFTDAEIDSLPKK